MDYSADASTGFKAVVKKTPELLTTPISSLAVIPISPMDEIPGQAKGSTFHALVSRLHSTTVPLNSNLAEEFKTVVHYPISSIGKASGL